MMALHEKSKHRVIRIHCLGTMKLHLMEEQWMEPWKILTAGGATGKIRSSLKSL